MSSLGKYLWTALVLAVLTHFAVLLAFPNFVMNTAMARVSGGHFNVWRQGARVTEASRAIVRPSPDLAYSTCVYDLSGGPIQVHVAPWRAYWSLSLYQDNSDNFFVIDDREAHDGADVIIIKQGMAAPDHATAQIVESPTTRGIALVRRLAPTLEDYTGAAQAGRADVCAATARSAH